MGGGRCYQQGRVKLFLCRHGEAQSNAASDAERCLTPAGSRRNRATATAFAERAVCFDLALVSPYRRAQQTAADLEAVLGNLNFQESHLITPDAGVSGIIEFLDGCDAENTLLVGHNPLLSQLLSLLAEGDLTSSPGLDTSELVCLEFDVAAPGCGQIAYRIRA